MNLKRIIWIAGLFALTGLSFRSLANNSGVIDEEGFVRINGIEQWITIHGDASKPAILFLHGGPGSTMTPYARNMYKPLEKDFVIIQWDQRGAGKTYGKNAPAELDPAFLQANPLKPDQMVADGIAVSEYALQHLNKKKVILFGTSWGSILGVYMSYQRPDLFYAYIGHSQIVNPSTNILFAYEKVTRMTEKANDVQSLETLHSIGPPPYDTARNSGRLYRVIKKYEKEHSTPAPDSFWIVGAGYQSAADEKNREDGDDYSFANFVGDKKLHIKPMMGQIDFMTQALQFKIPVFFIQGEEDILTSPEITRPYFDKITAPEKKYILLPQSAHGFNILVVETSFQLMHMIAEQIPK